MEPTPPKENFNPFSTFNFGLGQLARSQFTQCHVAGF